MMQNNYGSSTTSLGTCSHRRLILRMKESGIRATSWCQGASPQREVTLSTFPLLKQRDDKDPAQFVHLPSPGGFPALLINVAESVQWDQRGGSDVGLAIVPVRAALPHQVSCFSSYSLGSYLPESLQQRLEWIWYQIDPVSAPAPGSSLYQLGFHWRQTPPSEYLGRPCIFELLGPKQREGNVFRL